LSLLLLLLLPSPMNNPFDLTLRYREDLMHGSLWVDEAVLRNAEINVLRTNRRATGEPCTAIEDTSRRRTAL
jgi:hypothetical protein